MWLGRWGRSFLRLLNPTRHLSDIIAAALRTRKLWDRDAVSRSGFRCLLLVKSVCAPAAATRANLLVPRYDYGVCTFLLFLSGEDKVLLADVTSRIFWREVG